MTMAPPQADEMLASLARLRAEVAALAGSFVAGEDHLSARQTGALVASLEELARAVEFFQVAGAWAVERADIARVGECDGIFGRDGGTAPAAGAGAPGPAWADPAASFAPSAAGAAIGGKAKRGTQFR